jgi:rare lipoprotein A
MQAGAVLCIAIALPSVRATRFPSRRQRAHGLVTVTCRFRFPNPYEGGVSAMSKTWVLLASITLSGLAACIAPPAAAERNAREERARPGDDTSGRVQRGQASHYHRRLHGKQMANGERFASRSNSAASRTLPLGTTARVKNLKTGRMASVRIEDRGPYARGRILDVSPRTAEELGMTRDGTAPVEIAPVEVPQRDGGTRPGAGANR